LLGFFFPVGDHLHLLLRLAVVVRLCGLGLQLPIRKLILSEVLAHFVQSVDCPQGQFWYFYPSIVHGLCVHHHNYQMQGLLFKTSCKAWTSGGSDSGFEAIEPLAQQLVGVGPSELSLFFLDVLSSTSVSALVHDLTHEGVLHGDAG